jgi:hypothetical protein
MKILLSYVVTLLDLSMGSSVKEGSLIQMYNTAVRQYCKLPCPAKVSILNVLIPLGRHYVQRTQQRQGARKHVLLLILKKCM